LRYDSAASIYTPLYIDYYIYSLTITGEDAVSYKEPRYYSPLAFTKILFEMAYMSVKYKKELKLISKKFRSNIMLAVTYVNGCRICSYVHTKTLLQEGVTNEQLKPLLEGTFTNLDTEETSALIFAQHYADARGQYDSEAFRTVKKQYGDDVAMGILASVKLIMFGNVNGIALGNIWDRIRLKKAKKTNILTELYNAFSPILLLPVFLFINIFRRKLAF